MANEIFKNRVDNFTPYEYDGIMKKFKKELTAKKSGDFIDVIYKSNKRKVHLFRYDTDSSVAYTDLSDTKLLSMFNGRNPFNEGEQMQNYANYLLDEAVNTLKVEVREKGTTSTDNLDMGTFKPKDFKVVGWFSNKYNPAFGWAVFELDAFDVDYLKDAGVSNLMGVKRVGSDKGTNIVKFNLKTGTYAFAKDADSSGKIKFEKMVKYKKFIIDNEKYLAGF